MDLFENLILFAFFEVCLYFEIPKYFKKGCYLFRVVLVLQQNYGEVPEISHTLLAPLTCPASPVNSTATRMAHLSQLTNQY